MKKTRRTMQVGDQIRQELATIIQRDIYDPDIKFLTFTDVEVAPDFSYARAFVSVYGSEADKKSTMEALERAKSRIRYLVGQRVKLRVTPQFEFQLDDTPERADKIGKMLLDIEKSDKERKRGDND